MHTRLQMNVHYIAAAVGHDVAADNTQLMKLLRQKDDNLKEIIAKKNEFEKLLDNSVKEITNKDFEIKHLQVYTCMHPFFFLVN